MAANVTCALLLLFAWKMKKSLVGVSTLLNLLIYGVVADAVFAALKSVYETPSLIVRIVCLVSALFLLAFSGAMYYTADLGVSTYDAIALIMDDRKIGKFKYCRIAADLTLSDRRYPGRRGNRDCNGYHCPDSGSPYPVFPHQFGRTFPGRPQNYRFSFLKPDNSCAIIKNSNL